MAEEEKIEKFKQDPKRKQLSIESIAKALNRAVSVGPIAGTNIAQLQKIARVIRGRGKNATSFMKEVAKQYKEDYGQELRDALSQDFMGNDEDLALNAFGFATDGSFSATHQEGHAEDNGGENVPNFEAYGFKGTEREADGEYGENDPKEKGWADKEDVNEGLDEEKSFYDKGETADKSKKEEEEKKPSEIPAERAKQEDEKEKEIAAPESTEPQPTPVESQRIRDKDPITGPGGPTKVNPIDGSEEPNREHFKDKRVEGILAEDERVETLRDARRKRSKNNQNDTLQAVLDSINSGQSRDGIDVSGWKSLDKARKFFEGVQNFDDLTPRQRGVLEAWRNSNLTNAPEEKYEGEYRDGYKVGDESQLPSADADDPRLKNYQSNKNDIIVPGQDGEAGGFLPPGFDSEAEYMASMRDKGEGGGGSTPQETIAERAKRLDGNQTQPSPNPVNESGGIPLFGEDGIARDPTGIPFPVFVKQGGGNKPSLEDPEPATGSSDSESFSVDTKPTSDIPGGPRNEFINNEPIPVRRQQAPIKYDEDDFTLTEDGVVDNRPKNNPDDHIATPSKPYSMDDFGIDADGNVTDNRPKEERRIQTLPYTREDWERDRNGEGVQTLPGKPPSMEEIGREIGMITDPPVGTDTVLRPADQLGESVTPSKPVTQVPSADSDPTASLPPPPAAPSAADNPYASPTARFDDGYLPPLPEGMEIPDGTQPVYPEGSLPQPDDFPTHSENIEVAQGITDQETPDVSPQPAPTRAPSVEDPEPEFTAVQGPIRARDNPNATPEQKMFDDSFSQREMEPGLQSARIEGRRRNDAEIAQNDADELERMIKGRQLTEPSRYGEGDYKSNLKTDPSELFTQNEGLVQTGNDGRSTMKVGGSKQQMMPVYGANGLIGYKPIDPALRQKRQDGTLTKADRVKFDDPMAGGAATDALRLQDAYKNSKSATPHLDMRNDMSRMAEMPIQAQKDQYYRERMAQLHGVGVHGSELDQNMKNPNYNPLATTEMPSIGFDNLQETGRMLQADKMHPGHNLQTPEQQIESDMARRGQYRPGSRQDLRMVGFSDPDITMMKQRELQQKRKKQEAPRVLNSFV